MPFFSCLRLPRRGYTLVALETAQQLPQAAVLHTATCSVEVGWAVGFCYNERVCLVTVSLCDSRETVTFHIHTTENSKNSKSQKSRNPGIQ